MQQLKAKLANRERRFAPKGLIDFVRDADGVKVAQRFITGGPGSRTNQSATRTVEKHRECERPSISVVRFTD
jgi:hypothetical protein